MWFPKNGTSLHREIVFFYHFETGLQLFQTSRLTGQAWPFSASQSTKHRPRFPSNIERSPTSICLQIAMFQNDLSVRNRPEKRMTLRLLFVLATEHTLLRIFLKIWRQILFPGDLHDDAPYNSCTIECEP